MKHQLAISVLMQHKRRAQKHAASHESLSRDLPAEDEVYTNAEIAIVAFPKTRLNQYLVSKI